ncbi:hypothetical protein O2K51_00625 [Apibacter raozihei]|uniref:hypothetical protein n=1 Tax=Apibacter raozihei TaxID=2500547 RepID=UPI000FE2F939|nr:hypothetical protein [Apibacter raozihei]
MNKKIFLLGANLMLINFLNAQVGINTNEPHATFHVSPITSVNNSPEGIIAPVLTRASLISKNDSYGDNQKGAIVYVSDLSGTLTTKTAKVTYVGYYYFDGVLWQHMVSSAAGIPAEPWQVQGSTVQATDNTQNIYQSGSVNVGGQSVVSSNYKFQVSGNEYITGTSKIGGTSVNNSSAQLELGDSNKGFLPNRVALVGATNMSPMSTVVDGLLVYNTTSSAASDLYPGYYFWMNKQWNRLQNERPKSTVNLLNLATSVTTNAGTLANLATSGTVLPFGAVDATTKVYSITLTEDGAYAFNFRLYGAVKETTGTSVKAARTVVYYIGLLKNNTLVDAAELDINIIPTTGISTVATYSVVLACDAKAGDKITFRMNHFTNTVYPWTLSSRTTNTSADRTSLVWWKL